MSKLTSPRIFVSLFNQQLFWLNGTLSFLNGSRNVSMSICEYGEKSSVNMALPVLWVLKRIANVLRRSSNEVALFTVCALVVGAILDTTLVKLYRFINSEIFSASNIENSIHWNIELFIAITIILSTGQLVVLEFVKRKSKGIKTLRQLHLDILQRIASIVQYVLIILLAVVILEVLLTSSYDVNILIIALGISYLLAIIMMGFLAERFFLWFKLIRNFVILSYGLATVAIIINAGFTLFYVSVLLGNLPQFIMPHVSHISPLALPSSLNAGYVISSLASFGMTWIATVTLMHHYSRSLGKGKYWLIVSIPLVYFIGQSQPLLLGMFSYYQVSNPVLFGVVYTLLFTLSKPIGGILFGVAFWSVARNVYTRPVRDYMIISAFGFVLFFSSNQAIVLVDYNYPPFGLPTISLVGTSSYFILVGIFCSALSVSQDVKLRESIRTVAAGESALLDGIGTAQMERELVNRVLKLTKEQQSNMAEETGVGSSLSEEDIKQYLAEVIEEIKDKRDQQK